MWSTIKTILPSKSKGINICNNDKAKEKADNFNKHFANICSTHDMRQSTNDSKDSLNFTNTAKNLTKNPFTFQAINACVNGHLEPTHLKSSPLFTFSTKS